MNNFWKLSAAIAFIWFGMVCAISFMEAWLKFEAPGVTLEIGLGIGRLVFDALNRMELIFAVLLSIFFLKNRQFLTWTAYWLYLVWGILIAQTFWLLPVLDERALQIISGEVVPQSYYHLTYIVMDFVKVFSLLVFGVKNLKNQDNG